jgi:hypothetical protein
MTIVIVQLLVNLILERGGKVSSRMAVSQYSFPSLYLNAHVYDSAAAATADLHS